LYDEVGFDAHDEQPILEILENSIKRSTRDKKPSSKYSTSKFVLLIDGENVNAMTKLWKMNKKLSGLKR